MTAILESVVTCPACKAPHLEVMPENACVHWYECASCHEILKPIPGDCCVFCSFGSVGCPPCQLGTGAA
ncbi:MAG TPA: GDCCVxC domain-containing (seleno)protein [Gemmatimonadales bacterium]|nr:GDCCVxC domain-containing (seleno)protein [Gemmatimonadales bacterium]